MIDDPNPFANALILIVDDDETQRLLTRDHLERAGFSILESSSGEEALEIARESRPSLILLDVMMPGMDGLETCRQIRADPSIRHVPVILVTGKDDSETVEQGYSAGATDFLPKPIHWDLLPHRIRYVRRTGEVERQLRKANETARKDIVENLEISAPIKDELKKSLNDIQRTVGLMLDSGLNGKAAIHASGIKDSCETSLTLLYGDCDIAEIENIDLTTTEQIDGVLDTTGEAHQGAIAEGESDFLILVAEDNPINQRVIRGMLEKAGYRVDIASNGLEALEAVQRQSYDLVLMDIHMPVMDGITATKKIRELPPPLADLPIIAVTANQLMSEPARLLKAGMNDYVAKPIEARQMSAAIERQCNVHCELESLGLEDANEAEDLSAQQKEAIGSLNEALDELLG